ncbi:helix-turn-helix domain-containing protein [Streptomyces sp. DSM 116496]|uniref:helix-turn-helix domain-containing protein n=1 Tax=Streptomyces stoeckheimensis TaxID=3344656 RepID=UPI0038B3B723
MGRPENPVDFTVSARGELAALLRKHRQAAGLTYEQLAARTGLSSATLKRAAAGKRTPSETVVMKFVGGCDVSKSDVLASRIGWARARLEERGFSDHRVPTPGLIASRGELSRAIVDLYERAGAPPLRLMQERAGAEWLAISSAHRIINRQALPRTREQMAAFLRGCGIRSSRAQKDWLNAWARTMSTTPAPLAELESVYWRPGSQHAVFREEQRRRQLRRLERNLSPQSLSIVIDGRPGPVSDRPTYAPPA